MDVEEDGGKLVVVLLLAYNEDCIFDLKGLL